LSIIASCEGLKSKENTKMHTIIFGATNALNIEGSYIILSIFLELLK
jgi:hypothetical protein